MSEGVGKGEVEKKINSGVTWRLGWHPGLVLGGADTRSVGSHD